MEIHHYIQNWKSHKRIIIVSNKGSVFVELSNQYLYHNHNLKAEIWGLFVLESFRNKGVAKQLMQYAETLSKQFGESCVAVVWDSSTPSWILKWYKKSGYKFSKHLNNAETLLIKNI